MTLPGESIIALREDILERFCRKFIIESYANLKKSIEQGGFLLWNNKFKVDLKLIPTSDFANIEIDRNKTVYYYYEGRRDLRKCKLSEFERFLDSREPWEDVDIEVFDETLEWTMIVTHEDCTLLYGVDVKK